MRAAPKPVAEPLWAALREREEPISVSDLSAQLRLDARSILNRIIRWERAGFVSRAGFSRAHRSNAITLKVIMTEQAGHHSRPPRVAPDGQLATPIDGRQRIWSAIRVLKRFDRKHAEMTSEQNRRSVEDYLNCLLRAGYIRRLHPANSVVGTLAEYQVVRNTGRKAPIVRHGRREDIRFREVFDPNTGAVHDISPRSSRAQHQGERE